MGGQAMDAKRLSGGFLADPNDLTIVGFDTDDGPEHPLWDKRCKLPADENLADAMLRDGFQGAIEVRKNGEKDGKPIFEVVIGRRRTKSARRAQEKSGQPFLINVLVRKYTEEEAFAVRVGENIRRLDLSPLDKADEMHRYMKRGHNEKEAAIVFDMTVNGVKNIMRAHDLSADVRKAIEAGALSFAAAAELADLPRDEQGPAMVKLLEAEEHGEKVTKRSVKKAKAARNNSDKSVAPAKRMINKILQLNKRNNNPLNEDVVKGILWTLGDMPSEKIKGMRDLEKEIEDLIAKRAAKKTKKKAKA